MITLPPSELTIAGPHRAFSLSGTSAPKGFPRNAKPKDGDPIGWNDIKDLQSGTAQRTITYQAPFTKCDRVKDYEQVWARLDSLAGDEPAQSEGISATAKS